MLLYGTHSSYFMTGAWGLPNFRLGTLLSDWWFTCACNTCFSTQEWKGVLHERIGTRLDPANNVTKDVLRLHWPQ